MVLTFLCGVSKQVFFYTERAKMRNDGQKMMMMTMMMMMMMIAFGIFYSNKKKHL